MSAPRSRSLALALACGLAAAAEAQVPAGPEFRVNASTLGIQDNPHGVHLSDGRFVVAWSEVDGSDFGVRAQIYDARGVTVGAAFQVNTYTTGRQRLYFDARNVAADDHGRFVVVWNSLGQDGSSYGVFARLFDATGAPRGPEFQVNTYTTGDQDGVSVDMAADGRFVVAWQSMGQDGSLDGVFARPFDQAGSPQGAELQVNTYTTSGQLAPDVALRPGLFVVVWMSAQDGSGNSVHGRGFDLSGLPLGPEFLINSTTTFSQTFPVVAGTPIGFVVAWESDLQDGSDDGIYAQRFDAVGVRLGSEFRVNTYTTTRQSFPSIAADEYARFTITWESLGQDGSTFGAFAQRFDNQGLPRGGEFRVNATTSGSQMSPRIDTDAVGNLLVAWHGPDGSAEGAFAQRYGGLRPNALSISDGGNGVLEVSESFEMVTAWRNVNGVAQTFSGQAIQFTCPAGLTCPIGSATAAYGTVPDGAVGACVGPCFTGSLQGTRTPGHLDLDFREQIDPPAQGQVQRWLLHVGGSFSDVPTSSGFYRFVETLLHHGVTGGCSSTDYCPGSPTTREQMAVFVLVAREGLGYIPPACVPPNLFADVPETSAFCPWIEELANRNVVGGCGGGNYCPFSPVTREQMAVFVLRTLDPALNPPACSTPLFADVPASSPFCRWIEELARRGVVTGCGGGNYCPTAAVTREQMGVFISVTFGLSLYGP